MTDLTPSAPKGENDFLPKLLTVLREGYGLAAFRADAIAGLTVAIVALPLSMAIAIASGVGPERGLFTTIVGGFLISALGGSRYQIGGPAGAFIVGVSACVAEIGVQGLMVATLISGVLLIAAGALRLGHYVRFLPYPVTIGFSAGIAVIIFVSQIKEVLGLTPAAEPAAVLPKLLALWQARDGFSPETLGVSVATIVVLQVIKRLRPHWPNLLITACGMSFLVWALGLPVALVGDRFGALPHFLPAPQMPDLSAGSLWAALPFALQFTLLGAITGLLSAQVADGISGNRHRPSIELFAEGAANIAVSFIGGVYATGAVARTVTNHAAGSRGPISGMLHAIYVLGFLMLLAPLIAYVPMAVFAGILCVVAWNMAARAQFVMLLRASRADGLILLTTFGLVVFRDLTEGIVMGFALAGLVFLHRMSKAVALETDIGDDPDRVVVHLSGPWFFGAAAQTGALLEQLSEHPKHFVLDMKDLDYLDSSGARALELLARRVTRQGGRMVLSGVRPAQRIVLEQAGLTPAHVDFIPDLATLDRV